jgi:tellurite resistance protein TerC
VDVLVWSVVGAAVLALLVVDLVVFSGGHHEVSLKEAGIWSAVWLAVGLGFALVVWALQDGQHAGGYLAGYLIERSLSIDNVFIFALILTYFAVPATAQGRVLFFAVLAALVLRGVFIVAGAAVLESFHFMEYVFGAFLVLTVWRMFRARSEHPDIEKNAILRGLRRVLPSTDGYRGGRLVVRERGRLLATPMLVVLLAMAFVDVAFAVDSIPAIFAVTTDAFLVFTSNAFAVLGLRAMYFLLAGVMDRFVHLKVGLAAVLALVGAKMLVADLYVVPVWASLVAIVAILGLSIAVSLRVRPTPTTEGGTDATAHVSPAVDRQERPADRRDGGGDGAAPGGRRDGRDTGARAGRDHPRPGGAGDRVRVGPAGAREGQGPGEANG